MSNKLYGIVLVPRRIYNLLLVTLFAIIINIISFNSVMNDEDKIVTKVNNKYGSPNIECVIEAVYFEARGESEDGWRAATEVILNRSKMNNYPNSLCEVVWQNKQFSYRNGKTKKDLVYSEPTKVYQISKVVYKHLYDIDKHPKHRVLPECVSHYDGKAFKKPYWAKQMKMVKEVGNHQFYCLI